MIVARVKTNEGAFCAVLGKPGRLYTPFVSLASFPVRKYRIANGDVKLYAKQLLLGTKRLDYPVKKAVNHMLRVGRMHGITKGARKLLMEAKSAA